MSSASQSTDHASDVATAPTIADAIGDALWDLGVERIFTLLGSGNFVAVHAFGRRGGEILHTRHENVSVAMADGWARVAGGVGVASLHTGPGLTNAITAIAEAAKSATPLVVLCGDVAPTSGPTNFRINQHGAVESVGAVAERVLSPRTVRVDVARAYRRAEVERRPVVLMMPMDMQGKPVPAEALPLPGRSAVPIATVPAPGAVADVADLVVRARRPVILAGRGAVRGEARDALEALGARIGALNATTAVAKGFFGGLPFDVGISGGFATPLARELLHEADVVLAFGAALNHWTTASDRMFREDAVVVHVDIDPTAIARHRPVNAAIIGDARETAVALERELGRRDHRATGFREPETARRLAGRRTWREEPFEEPSRDRGMDPRRISIEVNRLLPDERQVVTDSGTYIGFPACYLDVPDARSFVFPNAFMSVGLGLGAAMGAAYARPDRITVAALGDCGAMMSLGDLETLRRTGLPVLVLIYDDSSAGAEYQHYAPLGYEVEAVCFDDVDFAGVARTLGIQAIEATTPDDLLPIASWARDPHGPLLVDARMDRDAEPGVWLQEAFASH
jgi:thiamine pyrophosphate-dependent acetolactate synthase large subunit-like protein